jgi:hypothetical protein
MIQHTHLTARQTHAPWPKQACRLRLLGVSERIVERKVAVMRWPHSSSGSGNRARPLGRMRYGISPLLRSRRPRPSSVRLRND